MRHDAGSAPFSCVSSGGALRVAVFRIAQTQARSAFYYAVMRENILEAQ
jgi:hypothetical protein